MIIFTQNANIELRKSDPGIFQIKVNFSKRPHWNQRIIQYHYSVSQQQASFDIRGTNYKNNNLIYSVWQSITDRLN